MVRAVSRTSRKARPARVEGLEARAMLTMGILPVDFPSEVESVPLVDPIETINLCKGKTPDVVIDQELESPPDLSRVTMSFPWRVSSWLHRNEHWPGDRTSVPEDEFRFEFDPDAAKELPPKTAISWTGAVVSGEEGHLYRLEIAPGTRALSFSYAIRFEDRFDASVAALRVSLRDAEGNLIDSWWLDASVNRVDARLLSLVPSGPTSLYLGIEAVGPPTVSDTPIPYLLDVRQAAPPPTNWFPLPVPGHSQIESPVFGDQPPSEGTPLFGGTPRFSPSILLNLDARRGSDLSMMEAASGRSVAAELIAGDLGRPIGVEGGLVRPLPTQSASTVGGFLATGPAIRGDRDVPDRLPRIDEFADPLLMASEPVSGDSGEANPPGTQGRPEPFGEPSGSLAELAAFPIELAPESEGHGIARVVDSGTLPMFVAGLRITRGTPSMLSGEQFSPPIPDDLAALVATNDPPPSIKSEQEADESPKEDPDPTRPRVLRTALIGAAALAVGLLLPDLASERTLIRLRPSVARSRWWFFG